MDSVQGWPPDSSVRAFSLALGGPTPFAFEFSRHLAACFHHGMGPVQSTSVQIPSTNPLTIHWVLSGLWGLCPRARPRFGWKRSFQSLLLDGTWNPGQKFYLLCPCQGPSTRPTGLAISARPHELPSLNSVTWRKARRSIGYHREQSRCLFPDGPLDTNPDAPRAQSAVACTRY